MNLLEVSRKKQRTVSQVPRWIKNACPAGGLDEYRELSKVFHLRSCDQQRLSNDQLPPEPPLSRWLPLKSAFRRSGLAILVGGLAMALAGCAQEAPSSNSGVWRKKNTKEYFSQKRYGKASPRLVRNGRRVPKGGGRYIVGRPYKVAGKRYYPRVFRKGQTQVGRASWYGDAFHGRKTANGEIYDMTSVTAAHPTMPLPSYARVTNLKNKRSIIVRVNDRGPFHGGRVIDLSKRVADLLDFRRFGTARVRVDYLRPASVRGSSDRQLVASLRTNGTPAQLDGGGLGRTLFAGVPGGQRRASRTRTQLARTDIPVRPVARALPVQRQTRAANTTVVAAGTHSPSNVPLPLSRPFDLGTIPGAGTPIAAPARSGRNVARVNFFAPFAIMTTRAKKLHRRGPFDGIDLNRLRLMRGR